MNADSVDTMAHWFIFVVTELAMPSIWLFVLLILRLAWKKKGWQMGFAVEWGLLLTCIANAYLSAAFHLE